MVVSGDRCVTRKWHTHFARNTRDYGCSVYRCVGEFLVWLLFPSVICAVSSTPISSPLPLPSGLKSSCLVAAVHAPRWVPYATVSWSVFSGHHLLTGCYFIHASRCICAPPVAELYKAEAGSGDRLIILAAFGLLLTRRLGRCDCRGYNARRVRRRKSSHSRVICVWVD